MGTCKNNKPCFTALSSPYFSAKVLTDIEVSRFHCFLLGLRSQSDVFRSIQTVGAVMTQVALGQTAGAFDFIQEAGGNVSTHMS